MTSYLLHQVAIQMLVTKVPRKANRHKLTLMRSASHSKSVCSSKCLTSLNLRKLRILIACFLSLVSRSQTSRLVCFSTWCLLVNLMTTLVLIMLTNFSDHISCPDGFDSVEGRQLQATSDFADNVWIFKGESTAIFIDVLTRLVILNSALMPRVVFVKTAK